MKTCPSDTCARTHDLQPRVLEAALVAEAEEREGRGPRRVELAPLLHLRLDEGVREARLRGREPEARLQRVARRHVLFSFFPGLFYVIN